ncbi:hypothetical protein TTHERM_01020760 (macronuclear) [Tetrahymena thermophila SB210]|uniref:Uncharacterized protein n=1 Tax=Tetrahymena thermophila (strain SB210) TaxID=312017 RepID=Q24BZ4_TETTS|nr:hypothetical protein TTHERM_01020760 [Tetrahymena thermophila SB210]EAS05308.2 hypothetical protein TTHERM_01020760 [Tetrahymena thermophila SB210]|eukprot:XP_001025553.2 hypothetical protein TTHERM_01020760 [Tetrahymena thermophila SB210]
MYYSSSNPYIAGNQSLQFNQGRESAYLSKIGENIIYNQDYAQAINKNAKNKYEYGEILRLQMQEKQDQKSLQREQQYTNFNRSQVQNPQQLSDLQQNRNFQMKSDIFNQGNQNSYQYTNNQFETPQQQPNYRLQQQNFPNNQDYLAKREEYLKKSEVYWSQPKNYRGSLLKEYYNDNFYEEKERKQKAFAQGLADQINEKKIQQKQQDRPKQIDYLPESEVLEKNRSNILDSIMKIQSKANQNGPQNFQFQLEPTNSYNKNHILYYELNKSENAYRWQPGGEWQRGKADFDVLKGLYKKQGEVFEKQKEELRVIAENAQKQRDKSYVEMVIMRDKISNNDKARALNVKNEYFDSTTRNEKDNEYNPHNYFQNKQGLNLSLEVPREKYDNIYFKHNYELPSQSAMLDPNYIQNKFDKKLKQKSYNQQGNQFEEEDENLEKMLDNFYQEEVGLYEGDNQNLVTNARVRSNSTGAKIDLSKIKYKNNQNQLNQSQFTEYNLLHQLEEGEEKSNNSNQQQNQEKNSQTDIQKTNQNGTKKSDTKIQQDNEFNDANVSQGAGLNSKNEEINNLDLSKIESQKSIKISNQNNKSQNQLKDFEKQEEESLKIEPIKRPFSSFNKRSEVKIQNIKNRSDFIPYRKIKEKSLYQKQKEQIENQNIDYKKLYSIQEKNNLEEIQDNLLDKSAEKDQQLDNILEEIGGMIKEIHTNDQQQHIPNDNFRQQMQYDKSNQIKKLQVVNNYNNGYDNPYVNDIYKQQNQSNKIIIDNTPENKLFLQSSNHIDYLIGQLVQDRKIY